jgi:hypothetical protein
MSLLGIIMCQSLELEFANILANDPDVSTVYVLKDKYSVGFSEAVEASRGGLTKSKDYIGKIFPPEEGFNVVVQCMRVGLHSVIAHLREGVKGAAMEMGPFVDAILLGYGLCGNALGNPRELLANLQVPLFIPMDEDHPVDDCVGLLIGGRENYYEEQCKCAGTMFWTPGFARHWKEIFREGESRGYEPDMVKRLLRDYERVLLLPSPVMEEEELMKSAEEFAERFGLRTETRSGSLEILQRTWSEVKEYFRSVSDRQGTNTS